VQAGVDSESTAAEQIIAPDWLQLRSLFTSPPPAGEFSRFAVARGTKKRHNTLVTRNANTNTNTASTPPQPRRKVTLIEVVVMVTIGAVILRFVYHVVHWRDMVKAVVTLKPYEWAILVVFLLVYYFLNRRDKNL
jgi:hypothetical protein